MAVIEKLVVEGGSGGPWRVGIAYKVLFMSCSPLTMIPPLILGWDIVLHTACGSERCIHST